MSWIKGKTDALPCHIHISVHLRVMDLGGIARVKYAGYKGSLCLRLNVIAALPW